MPRYVAFLRAINVGGHTVRMEELRSLFRALGFSEVETFIASGNVIFCSPDTDVPAMERRIEAKLKQSLGYPVATFVRSVDELKKIAQYEPFPADASATGKSTVYIMLLSRAMTPLARKQLLACKTEVDDFAVKGREVYWLCRGNMLDSKFSGAQLERTALGAATMRNRNTIVRLAAKYPD